MIGCRAIVLAEALAVVDGVAWSEPHDPCTAPVSHAVVIRRDGIELAADVCAGHERLIYLDAGYQRSIKKKIRT